MKGVPRTDCAVDAAMSVIEGRWKTVIICILARNGEPMRFNQLINKIDGNMILKVKDCRVALDESMARRIMIA